MDRTQSRVDVELVHNHHNFAWKEQHDGREYIVVRKGTTPALPGQKGFKDGSMGDGAVRPEGATKDSETQRVKIVAPAKVSWEMVNDASARVGSSCAVVGSTKHHTPTDDYLTYWRHRGIQSA